MKNKKKKKVLDDSKQKRVLFKKNKKKIIELKNSKKIKEILPEKIESGLEKEIEETNVPRFKDILKATESSPVLERVAVAETKENLEQEIASSPVSEKEDDEKINYTSNPENSTYLSETNKSEADNFEYPSGINYSEISAGTITPRNRRDFNKRVNETRLTRQEFLDSMSANRTNTMGRNQERTFEVHDKKYIDAKEEDKKYANFKQ